MNSSEINFSTEKLTALIGVNKDIIDLESKKETAKKFGLLEKSEFHITLIGSETAKKISEILEKYDENGRMKKLDYLKNMFNNLELQIRLIEEYYYIEKIYEDFDENGNKINIFDKRKSIIQMATIPELQDFYKELNVFLNSNFDIPLPHITLFTNSTREDKKLRGIGIYSKDDFLNMNPQKI